MNDVLQKVLISVATTGTLALLTLLFRSVRMALFYKRVEYDFLCERAPGQSQFTCSWNINWEDYRLEFQAGDISNDKIENATFKKFGGKTQTIAELFPSDSFVPLFSGEIQMKLNSIIRCDPASGSKVYTLRMVFRRRRFFSQLAITGPVSLAGAHAFLRELETDFAFF